MKNIQRGYAKTTALLALALALMGLAGCGGGGGGGSANPSAPPAAVTTLSGVASKGPFLMGSAVQVYAVNNGSKGALLAQTATTDNGGAYSVSLGSYTGPVLVEVTGSYQDEATGSVLAVPVAAPLRAALPQAEGNVTLPVTPLTELAVRQTNGDLSTASITSANSLISSLFKVDIVATMPVVPTAAAMTGATQAQKDYTLALAAVSQLASTSAGTDGSARLGNALASLNQGISSGGMTASAVTTFQSALTAFVTSNAHNQTGVATVTATDLAAVGTVPKSYTLMLQGAGNAKGVQFELALPAGVSVNLNADASLPAGSLSLTGMAATTGTVTSIYASGTVTLAVASQGISGAFATLTCNVPSGAAPPGSAFSVKDFIAVGFDGTALSGTTVVVE